MTTLTQPPTALDATRSALIEELRRHALVLERVTLSSGVEAEYFIDAKRVILQPTGFQLLATLVQHYVKDLQATAVGGLTLGADAIACAALVGAREHVKGFFVRKEPKPHGLHKLIEGPPLQDTDRCLIVDDVVTSGASTIKAIQAIQEQEIEICGVLSILDRLVGGGPRIEDAAQAPYIPLTTIDDVYPDRPDRKSA
jgi:orotate phosphoribosyltransferase